jgi:hypothetical protein
VEPGRHVGGDEHDLRRPADELVFDGPALGSDEREDGGAVGRRNRDPAIAGLEPGVDDEPEAQLAEVEGQAPVDVPHEDADRMDAEEGRGDTGRRARRRRRIGRVAGHPGIIGPGRSSLAKLPELGDAG